MVAGFIVLSCMTFVLGLAIGLIVGRLSNIRARTCGTIYVDCSDPDGRPDMFLESHAQVAELIARKHVMCDVVMMRSNSHK